MQRRAGQGGERGDQGKRMSVRGCKERPGKKDVQKVRDKEGNNINTTLGICRTNGAEHSTDFGFGGAKGRAYGRANVEAGEIAQSRKWRQELKGQ
jgi:hypothetical protein